MKPRFIGIIVIILVVGLGAVLFFNQNSNSSQVVSESQEKSESTEGLVIEDSKSIDSVQTIGEKKIDSSNEVLTYQPYSKTAYDQAVNKRRVLYFFATWCPECIDANAEFEAKVNVIPDDIAILRVNYNDPDTDEEEKALARKYAITYQHIFVQVDAQGNEITKWHGGALDKLLLNLK